MKKATVLFIVTLILVVIIEVSCSKTSEDQLVDEHPTTCDTVGMTYSADVLPILQANCYSCHGNGEVDGGIALDNFNNLKSLADNGTLLGVISHAQGYPPMPEGNPQLSECDINKIKSWIDSGALNN